jgi:hypothetical protein
MPKAVNEASCSLPGERHSVVRSLYRRRGGQIQTDLDQGALSKAGKLVKRCRLFCGGGFRPHPRITRVIGYVR